LRLDRAAGARRRPEHPMSMALVAPIECENAAPEVRAVRDDVRAPFAH
jgi:hypothetical protein